MSRVQMILTPAGERLAIMPAEDYESLVAQAASIDQDRADLARIDEILADERRGDALPLDGMKRISRVKARCESGGSIAACLSRNWQRRQALSPATST